MVRFLDYTQEEDLVSLAQIISDQKEGKRYFHLRKNLMKDRDPLSRYKIKQKNPENSDILLEMQMSNERFRG